VLDQTSFAKYELSGAGAERFLDHLCTNALPETGRIALTEMCRPSAGTECDVTITRLAEDRFYVVSAAATELHDYAWIEAHLPDDGSVRLENVTARYGVLTVAGPRARELLQPLADADLSREAFPFFHARELRIGATPVRALRLSYVGELGYELHHPLEHQRELYDLLRETGDFVDFGYRALDCMRLEKAYRLWGADMSADYTPFEAGMDRFVRLDKGDFIGRDALCRQLDEGLTQTLACLTIETSDADAHGYEPVFGDGRAVGYVASGGYGHTVEKSIALAYLPVVVAEPGTPLEVELLGERRPAAVVEQPLYDPRNERLLS
jgi:dimethylglycine dehydrogenase